MSPARIGFAFLLNIFVIPGAGQMMIKQKVRGTIWTILTVILLAVFLIHFTSIVMVKMQQLAQYTIDPSQMMSLAQPLAKGLLEQNMSVLEWYLYGLLICYVLSLVDLIYLIFVKKIEGESR